MNSKVMRLVLALVALWVAPAIAWVAYQILHKTMPEPNGLLIPLVIATVFLLGSWVILWAPMIREHPYGWVSAGFAFVIAAIMGIGSGFAVMAMRPHPRVGMIAIFLAGNLTWVVASTLFWSKSLGIDATRRDR